MMRMLVMQEDFGMPEDANGHEGLSKTEAGGAGGRGAPQRGIGSPQWGQG
jgi:hypothetical protein